MFATLANGSLRARQQAFSSCYRNTNRGTVHRKPVQPAPGSCSLSIPGTCAASKLQKQLQGTGQDHDGSSDCSLHHSASVLAAAVLAASVLACPGASMADDMLTTAQDAQALSMLLPAGGLAAKMSAAEAPGLVADSGTAVLEEVRDIVGQGLQDLTASSMTAVGGPVTGDVVTASANQDAQAEQQPELEPQQHSRSSSLPARVAPVQQQQQHMRSLWCNVWQGYCDALKRSPLSTKVYTGLVGTLLGDLAAQVLSHTSKQSQQKQQQQQAQQHTSSSCSSAGFHFDAIRAGRLCLYSAVIGTPMSHVWYGLLESTVLPASPLAPAAVAAKVALDQLLQTPFGMALFFAVMKVLEGKPGQVQPELQSKMMPALLANWKLWPAAQLINFTLIPEDQRILYGNVVGICWTCVISNMQQASGDEQADSSSADTAALAAAEAQPAGEMVSASSSAAAAAGPHTQLRVPVVGRLADAVFSQRKRSSTSLAA